MTLGAVYDRGYRPYDGLRGGRNASRLALVRVSMRRALGLRRSWRQKVFPWSLLVIAILPAIVNVGVGYLTRDSPIEDFEFFTYREYVGVSTALLLFVAVAAPDILCPDRRNRVLPLVFARPLSGDGYVAAKLGALFLIVFGFGFIPQVILFIGQLLVTTDGALDYFTANLDLLWKVPIAVAVLALYFASIGLALSATTERRIVGGVAFLALLLVTGTIGSILVEVQGGESMWTLVNLFRPPIHIRDLLFLGHLDPDAELQGVAGGGIAVVAEYVVIVGGCLLFLRHRYREVRV